MGTFARDIMPRPGSTKVFVRFLDSREMQVCPGHFFTDIWVPLSPDATAHIINASLTKNSFPPAPRGNVPAYQNARSLQALAEIPFR